MARKSLLTTVVVFLAAAGVWGVVADTPHLATSSPDHKMAVAPEEPPDRAIVTAPVTAPMDPALRKPAGASFPNELYGWQGSWMPAWLNPFRVTEASAMSTKVDFGVSIPPDKVYFIGVSLGIGPNPPVFLSANTTVGGGKPLVLLEMYAFQDGWYVLSVEAWSAGASASLVHANFSLVGDAPSTLKIGAWDYRNRPGGSYLYPALVELKAGPHLFVWTLESGSVTFLDFRRLLAFSDNR